MIKCCNKKCDKVWLDEEDFGVRGNGHRRYECKSCRSKRETERQKSQYGIQVIIPLPPNTKVCRNCKTLKDTKFFPSAGHGKLHCYCQECKYILEKERTKENKIMVYEYLLLHPCVDCGETNPLLLEFDHTDPSQKKYQIAQLYNRNPKKIMKEISKCEVRCRNCHIIKTAERAGWLDYHLSLIQEAHLRLSLNPPHYLRHLQTF